LLLVTCLAVGFAFWSWTWRRHQQEEAAVAAIDAKYSWVFFDRETRAPDWVVQVLGDEHCRMFRTVKRVRFVGEPLSIRIASPPGTIGRVADEHLAEIVPHLAAMPNLVSLELEGSLITDAGLDEVATLRHLESLDVEYTKVTDEGVARLRARLPALQVTH